MIQDILSCDWETEKSSVLEDFPNVRNNINKTSRHVKVCGAFPDTPGYYRNDNEEININICCELEL